MTESNISTMPPRASLVQRVAQRYDVDPEKLLGTLKATCFRVGKDQPAITNEQMMSLLIVAEQYNLNPFTKELFAMVAKDGGILPYVSLDGWSRIINEHAQYDGADFAWDREQESMTCTIHRKDRKHPTTITEYMAECRRGTQPWTAAPRRMLRHKSLMQCARLAFGFAGIYDHDEAERIRDGGVVRDERPMSQQRASLQQTLRPVTRNTPDVIEADVPTGTLADLTSEMLALPGREEALEVLDRARSILSGEDFAQLADTYEQQFSDEDQQP